MQWLMASTRKYRLVACVILGLAVPLLAEADNLISNGDFTDGLEDWPSYASPASASVRWDSAAGSPFVGSAQFETTGPGQEAGLLRCVALPPLAQVEFRFRHRTDPVDALRYEITFHDNAQCYTPPWLGGASYPDGSEEEVGEGWIETRIRLDVTAEASYAQLWFGLPGYLPAAIAHVDGVSLVDPEGIFSNDFEQP